MMNYFKTNRIALLASLLGITYGFLVANTFINDWDNIKRASMQGVEYAAYNKHSKNKPHKIFYFSLSPKEGAFNYPDSLVNLMNNTTVKSINRDVIALGSSDTGAKYSLWYDFFQFLVAWTVVITYFVIPFHFSKLLGRIKKNLLFEQDNIRLIRYLGIELMIIYFGNVLIHFINYKRNSSLFRFSNYEINMHSMDAIWLLFGIVILLTAEILSNALALKEEQELTI